MRDRARELVAAMAICFCLLPSPGVADAAVVSGSTSAGRAATQSQGGSSLESAAAKAGNTGRAVAMSLIGLALAVSATVLAFRRDFKEAAGRVRGRNRRRTVGDTLRSQSPARYGRLAVRLAMIEVRSYRRVFDLERRIYTVDRLRLNPGGVPVRGVLYFLWLLVAMLLLSALPLVGSLLGAMPWYMSDLIGPGCLATVLSIVRDRRPNVPSRGTLVAGVLPSVPRARWAAQLVVVR